MRVLILGGAGMLGHKLWQMFHEHHDTWVTLRSGYSPYARLGLFERDKVVGGVDASDFDSITNAIATVKPHVVINCIGIIKQLATANDPIISLSINSIFPHRLAKLCRLGGIRVIHISSDCVFSGKKGNYSETDISDAEDLYGKSKYLGEIAGEKSLTIRTSIIGRELSTVSGLVEWFLAQEGKQVKGYRKAVFSGFTTPALARIIRNVIENHPNLEGLYQVSAEPINKYDLLVALKAAFNVSIDIEPFDEFSIDRSLDSSKFKKATGFKPEPWGAMVAELAHDASLYEQLRKK